MTRLIKEDLEELVLLQARDGTLTDRDIVDEVYRRHPRCATTIASVRKTRTDLRKAGHAIPSRRDPRPLPPEAATVVAAVEEVRERADELPRKDFSAVNPRYHRLLVTYAQEDLRDFQQCIDLLTSEHSRVNRSIMAGLIHEERARLIRSDAAYQEAAWRVLAEDEIPYEPAVQAGDKAVACG